MVTNIRPPGPLFTIGHSDHSAADFLGLLQLQGITAVADVRSAPYSRWHPHFNREAIAAELTRAGIKYVFLGRELGARRDEPECYEEGKARYELIARAPLFQAGLERVRRGLERYRVALMCAEKDPLTCHRAILVCRHLKDAVPIIHHILPNGTLESHSDLESRLLDLAGLADGDLFRTRDELLAEAYDGQGERIAYVESRAEEVAT
jgi:uncharacterized protein (DUF488 family)